MTEKCYMYKKCNKIDCDAPFCLKKCKCDYLFNAALMTESQRKHIDLLLDEDNRDKEAFNQLKAIEKNINQFVEDGDNLYIYSGICGNSKTSWANRLAQTYINNIWYDSELKCRVLFISVPRFILELKSNITTKSEYIAHIKENVLDCDLVIFDDISSKMGTEFEISHLLSIIDTRLNNNKANIFTSNIAPENLVTFLDSRLASRIANTSIKILLLGADKRNLKYILKE